MVKNYLFIGFLICLIDNMPVFPQTYSDKDLYLKYNHHNFRDEPLFSEVIDFSNIDYNRLNAVLFHLTNEIRVKYRLQPLSYSHELERTAMMHARDMVTENFFSHINERDVNKRTPNDRAMLCNVANPFLAENIIEGFGLRYKSFETVYNQGSGKFSKTPDGELIKAHSYISFGEIQIAGWMNSKDHRKNILSKEALQLGCGAAYFANSRFNAMPSFMVVQNFQWYQSIKLIKP